MLTVMQTMDQFTVELQERLSISVLQGRPALGRDMIGLPCAAVEMIILEVQPNGKLPVTLSTPMARRRNMGVNIHLFAASEYEVWVLCETMATVMEGLPGFRVGGEAGEIVTVEWGALERNYGDLDAVLNYAISVTAGLNWRK